MKHQILSLPGDGLDLSADAFGDPAAPPVLFFHGGGQSRRSWRGSAQRVAQAGYYGLTFDLRGHGGSGWAADGNYLVDAFARDIEFLLSHFERNVTLVGASRGGQACLIAGSRCAGKVNLVMLADVAPHMRDDGVGNIRSFFRASDAGFATLEEAADVLHLHLGQPRLSDVSGLAKSMRSGGDRRLYWHWDPRTTAPQFLHPPSEAEALVSAAREIRTPIVVVKGEMSEIVTADSIAAFRAMTPQLEVIEAKGVGHMFTGDRNDAFARTLLRYLDRHAPIRA